MNIEKTVSQCLKYFTADKRMNTSFCLFEMNFGSGILLINRKIEWANDMGCECSLQGHFCYAEQICVVRMRGPNHLGVKGTAQFQLKSTVSSKVGLKP